MWLGNIKGDKIQFHFGVENSALLIYQKHINTLMVLFKHVPILPNKKKIKINKYTYESNLCQ